MLTSHPVVELPEHANIWLRYPFLVTCSGTALELHAVHVDDKPPRCLSSISLAAYDKSEHLVGGGNTGRGSNVVHGCDFCSDVLACGTVTGLVLVIQLQGASAAATPPAAPPPPPPILELAGHSKVVGFLRLGAGATRLFTSSLDKSVRLWSLPDGACLQMVKAGTPVLQLVLLPTPSTKEKREEEAGRAVLGCEDGTVRLWDPRCRKANKALTPLKFTHKDYVGELRLAGDGPRTLSGVCV